MGRGRAGGGLCASSWESRMKVGKSRPMKHCNMSMCVVLVLGLVLVLVVGGAQGDGRVVVGGWR